jgi:hypothetical protein
MSITFVLAVAVRFNRSWSISAPLGIEFIEPCDAKNKVLPFKFYVRLSSNTGFDNFRQERDRQLTRLSRSCSRKKWLCSI